MTMDRTRGRSHFRPREQLVVGIVLLGLAILLLAGLTAMWSNPFHLYLVRVLVDAGWWVITLALVLVATGFLLVFAGATRIVMTMSAMVLAGLSLLIAAAAGTGIVGPVGQSPAGFVAQVYAHPTAGGSGPVALLVRDSEGIFAHEWVGHCFSEDSDAFPQGDPTFVSPSNWKVDGMAIQVDSQSGKPIYEVVPCDYRP